MVHHGSRRHRLAAHEVPLVHALITEKLHMLYEERLDLAQAEELYRVVHRMDNYHVGAPAYPSPFTWATLEAYLMVHNDWSVEPGDSEDARELAPRGAELTGSVTESEAKHSRVDEQKIGGCLGAACRLYKEAE